MDDHDVEPALLAGGGADRLRDLVDSPRPPHRVAAEEADRAEAGGRANRCPAGARQVDDQGRDADDVGGQAPGALADRGPGPAGFLDELVGVDAQHPTAAARLECAVAGQGEVVVPFALDDPGAARRARVDRRVAREPVS